MNLNEEINKIIQENTHHSDNIYSIDRFVYLRLSKLDNTIPKEEDRVKDAIKKLRADLESLKDKYKELAQGFLIFIEVGSAYKNNSREEFNKLCYEYLFNDIYSIKDLFESNMFLTNKKLYTASFDRLSRVFFDGLLFQLIRKLRNINIYTLSSEEVYFEESYDSVKDLDNTRQLMFVFQLMMFSSSASKHSEDMSYKIKKRVSTKKGVTVSSKTGNKWGRKRTISDKMRKRIIERSQSFTAKEISEQKDIYQNKNGSKNKIALNTILSIIQNE